MWVDEFWCSYNLKYSKLYANYTYKLTMLNILPSFRLPLHDNESPQSLPFWTDMVWNCILLILDKNESITMIIKVLSFIQCHIFP